MNLRTNKNPFLFPPFVALGREAGVTDNNCLSYLENEFGPIVPYRGLDISHRETKLVASKNIRRVIWDTGDQNHQGHCYTSKTVIVSSIEHKISIFFLVMVLRNMFLSKCPEMYPMTSFGCLKGVISSSFLYHVSQSVCENYSGNPKYKEYKRPSNLWSRPLPCHMICFWIRLLCKVWDLGSLSIVKCYKMSSMDKEYYFFRQSLPKGKKNIA